MDLWTALFTVFRRWYVSLPLAILAVVAMIGIGSRIEQEYEATASVVLIPPQPRMVNGIQVRPDNPYDARSAGAAIYRRVNNVDLERQFEQEGFSPDYEVVFDRDAGILDFVVTGKSPDEALSTAERLIAEAQTNLARIQQIGNVGADAMITLQEIGISAEAEPLRGDKLRVQATVLLLGLVASVSSAFVVESFANRRKGLGPGLAPAGMPVVGGLPPGAVYAPGAVIPGTVIPGTVPPGYLPLSGQPNYPAGVLPPDAALATNGHHGHPGQEAAERAPSPDDDLYGSLDDLLDVPGEPSGRGSGRRGVVVVPDQSSMPEAGDTGRGRTDAGPPEPGGPDVDLRGDDEDAGEARAEALAAAPGGRSAGRTLDTGRRPGSKTSKARPAVREGSDRDGMAPGEPIEAGEDVSAQEPAAAPADAQEANARPRRADDSTTPSAAEASSANGTRPAKKARARAGSARGAGAPKPKPASASGDRRSSLFTPSSERSAPPHGD